MMNFITLFVFIICHTAAYDMNCPVPSERSMRSKTVCADYRNYTCLFDETRNAFKESCIVKNDFQRPGYRVTLRTNIHAKACLDDLYQPFIFYTNKSSDCELQRSFCSDNGQIVSSNGTIKTDRQCRCNYAQGYTYVIRPKNICSCKPSVEDCSCFRKKCSKNYILSPDYKCIDRFSWSGKFLCSSISDLRKPINVPRNIIYIRTEQAGFSRDLPEPILGVITLTVLSLIYLIVVILLQDNIPGIQLCCVENLQRVFKKGHSSTDAQGVISLKKVEDSLITQANMKIPTEEENNTTLKLIGHSSIDAQGAISLKNVEDIIITQANMEIPTEEENNKTLKLIDLNTPLKTESEDETSCLETGVFTIAKEKITSTNCMLLWGKPGCGKTTLLKSMTLYLQNHYGYTTVICNKPSDIFKPQFKAEKRAFVFDDICGRFVFSYEKFLTWKRREKHILRLLRSENVKLLMTCSFFVFMNTSAQQFSLFINNAFELQTPILLPRDLYTTAKDSQEPGGYFLLRDELAYLHDLQDHYISKVNELRESNRLAFYGLLICILKKGCIDETVLTSDDHGLFTKLSSNVCNALNAEISRRLFLDNLYVLMDIFISKENGLFCIKHTALFELLAVYFGENLQQICIKYADSEIITQYCSLESYPLIAENERFCIQITKENEELYFQRIKELLLHGNTCEVFRGRQMKLSIYQMNLAASLKKLGKEVVNQISRSKCKIEGETTFTLARRLNCNALLHVFFECDDSINLEDYHYLESACNTKSYPFAKLLVQRGININKQTSDGCTALHIAIKNGFFRLIHLLVGNGADVDCRDTHGNTPLIEACKKENETVISLLLENKADINKSNSEGQTPLIIAARSGSKRIVDLLISKQAEVNKIDFSGCSCLMHSIQSEPLNLEIILTLLQEGADIGISSADGKTALIVAIEEEQEVIVNVLTNYATDTNGNLHANSSKKKVATIINKCDNRKIPPLIHACEFRNDKFDVVEYLLSKGAIINCCDEKDRTPLTVALANDDDYLVKCLIKHGAVVNFPGENRTTPLHEMCKYGQFNNVSLLVSNGSIIDIVDKDSMTPLMLASKGGYFNIAEFLVQKKASVDSVDSNGTTPLMLACIGGFNKIIHLLVENGADVKRRDRNGWTPLLSYANSSNDNPEIVRFLIEHGANKNETKQDGVSSLMMASFRGHLKIVEYLLQDNIDVNHADNYGKTAIFSACLSENMDIVSVLFDKGANTMISDKNGDTLMSLAKKNKLSKMIDFLTAFSEA